MEVAGGILLNSFVTRILPDLMSYCLIERLCIGEEEEWVKNKCAV